MSSHTSNTNGGTNGAKSLKDLGTIITSTTQAAIDAADIYHGSGTTYLHIDNPLTTQRHDSVNQMENPTGAVVPPISLATTFKQAAPGVTSARFDPNSFGVGYEYSRTGTRVL